MFEELGLRFEEKLLTGVLNYMVSELQIAEDTVHIPINLKVGDSDEVEILQTASWRYTTLVGMDKGKILKWRAGYDEDPHFSSVLKAIREDKDDSIPYPQYQYSDHGLLYFEDSTSHTSMCVPRQLRNEIMSEGHDVILKSAHGGYFKTYNKISVTYYWPQMSREIKNFVNTCDLCQKTKPRRHALVGLLQPIPIPSQLFKVVTVDFIPKLPILNGFDNIL